jgi:ATP-dependent DNA helicase RecQ
MRKGEYSSLILTNKAREILFDGGTVSMAFKKSVSSGAPKAAAKSAGGRIEENPELFERLRKLRTELAEQAKVPAYIIFSDATLHDICRKLPKNDVEFLYVSGVGSKKAERYGEVFTQEVKRWLSENPNVGESGELALSRRKKSQSAESFENKGGSSRRKKPMAERKLLSEIAAETAADRGLDERLVEHAIQAYLTLGGYLEQRGGELCVTPKGGVNGISMSTKCGNGGERTTVIEYRRAAQKLIDDALDEILS